jgi:hypothetical protein
MELKKPNNRLHWDSDRCAALFREPVLRML